MVGLPRTRETLDIGPIWLCNNPDTEALASSTRPNTPTQRRMVNIGITTNQNKVQHPSRAGPFLLVTSAKRVQVQNDVMWFVIKQRFGVRSA